MCSLLADRRNRLVLALAGFALVTLSSAAWGQERFITSEPAPRIRPIHAWSGEREWITSLAFLKDGRHLCIGTYEELIVRDARDKEPAKRLDVRSGHLRSLAISPNGKLLAAAHYQAVSLVDVSKWSIQRTLGEFVGYVTGVSFSPDGRLLATACEDNTAAIWNVGDGKLVHKLEGHSYPVLGVAFSPDGARIATAAGDETRVTREGEVILWNAADGKPIKTYTNHKKAATGVTFSPNGKFLASTGFDERVILYDLALSKATSYFAGHSRPTNAVLFFRDSKTLVSAAGGRAKDGNDVKIWVRETGNEIATLSAHAAKVDAIALSPDESLLATGSYDKSVALWDVKSILHPPSHPEPEAGTEKKVADTKEPKPNTVGAALAEAKAAASNSHDSRPIRVGVIGLDTSHAGAFTQVLNDPKAPPDVAGFRVVAAYPRGSADIESSASRIPKITSDFKTMGIEIVDSIDTLLRKVDVVLLETNDGRPHLEQALAVMKTKKPMFIDKPVAASLADAVAIFAAAKRYNVPVFSSSSLRYAEITQQARQGKIGKVASCETRSPCFLEKTHPDLFWYGIHGVESLFTVMGTGCLSVKRTVSTANEDVVVGTWTGGRMGTFHGGRGGKASYGGLAKGELGTLSVGQSEGYRPLVVEIVKFFKTGIAPVSPEETLEIYAFMEAADESKRQHGAEVTIESVMAKARAEAAKKSRD
jgi:WD40 repeat protein/predicted dehydrogenase